MSHDIIMERCKKWKRCGFCQRNGCSVTFPKDAPQACPFMQEGNYGYQGRSMCGLNGATCSGCGKAKTKGCIMFDVIVECDHIRRLDHKKAKTVVNLKDRDEMIQKMAQIKNLQKKLRRHGQRFKEIMDKYPNTSVLTDWGMWKAQILKESCEQAERALEKIKRR